MTEDPGALIRPLRILLDRRARNSVYQRAVTWVTKTCKKKWADRPPRRGVTADTYGAAYGAWI